MKRDQSNKMNEYLIDRVNMHEGKFVHPDYLPNSFGDIWITDASKRSRLRRLAEKGLIRVAYHERGWYKCNTYAALKTEETEND